MAMRHERVLMTRLRTAILPVLLAVNALACQDIGSDAAAVDGAAGPNEVDGSASGSLDGATDVGIQKDPDSWVDDSMDGGSSEPDSQIKEPDANLPDGAPDGGESVADAEGPVEEPDAEIPVEAPIAYDGNPCTWDFCEGGGDCFHPARAEGTFQFGVVVSAVEIGTDIVFLTRVGNSQRINRMSPVNGQGFSIDDASQVEDMIVQRASDLLLNNRNQVVMTASTGFGPWFGVLSSDGRFIHTANVNMGTPSQAGSAVAHSQGGVVVTVRGNQGPSIIRMTDAGNLAWQAPFGRPTRDDFIGDIEALEDGFIALGLFDGGYQVVKLNLEGRVLWTARLDGNPTHVDLDASLMGRLGLAILEDGTIKAAVSVSNDVKLFTITPAGAVLRNEVTIQDENLNVADFVTSMAVAADGSLFIGGWSRNPNPEGELNERNYGYGWVRQVNPETGEILSTVKMEHPGYFDPGKIWNLMALNEGGILAMGMGPEFGFWLVLGTDGQRCEQP